jgi:hypothetical protein
VDDDAADAAVARLTTRSVHANPAPLAGDGLLTSNPIGVSQWLAQIVSHTLAATGMSDRDLLEDRSQSRATPSWRV